ncbi:molecular chaperone GrpE [Desulfitispora alkaliphila]|uniref:nucleotide exchange factor GrpE n=1 Tax=Desulfitispora alkaliphila TaxID=622674 RepID=UPI003D1CED99
MVEEKIEEHLQEEEVAEENEVDLDLEEQLNAKDKEIEELYTRLQRLQADFENFRRRTKKEKEEFAKYANKSLIEEMLPILDNFERALQAEKDENNSFKKGVEMIFNQLIETLKKEGLDMIVSVGKEFDPNYHEAVMRVETDEFDENIIVEEMQKGYIFKEKVVRPSMVKVAKND